MIVKEEGISMRRFVVVVLDGFGIGEMDDVKVSREQDSGADTFGHIKKSYPNLSIPNLRALGLGALSGEDTSDSICRYGRMKLAHYGSDTFYGHQEIMGTVPLKPVQARFSSIKMEVARALEKAGFKVEERGEEIKFLVINQCMTIADNIECDLGSAINVTAALDLVSFDEVMTVGKIVRSIAKVPRVIAFGGEGVSLSDILNAIEEKGDYIGINAPRSGVYRKHYQCIHLGYGVDATVQVPYRLAKQHIKTYLIGKVADIVENPYGESYSIVDTDQVFERALDVLGRIEEGFVCINVQETDLAGHSQDTLRYKDILEKADLYIGKIKETLANEDCLFIIADHGNDPTIGHSKHTREYVPLLVYQSLWQKRERLQDRQTLADVGATALRYFEDTESVFGEPIHLFPQ